MTFHPIAADARALRDVKTEGFFARMIRLWIEHHARMAEYGVRPL